MLNWLLLVLGLDNIATIAWGLGNSYEVFFNDLSCKDIKSSFQRRQPLVIPLLFKEYWKPIPFCDDDSLLSSEFYSSCNFFTLFVYWNWSIIQEAPIIKLNISAFYYFFLIARSRVLSLRMKEKQCWGGYSLSWWRSDTFPYTIPVIYFILAIYSNTYLCYDFLRSPFYWFPSRPLTYQPWQTLNYCFHYCNCTLQRSNLIGWSPNTKFKQNYFLSFSNGFFQVHFETRSINFL